MAHIIAWGAAKPRESIGLEGQNGQHMVDGCPHRPRSPRPPRPDGRADIANNRNSRRPRPHAARDALGEILRVDKHETIGRVGQDRPRGLVQTRQQPRQSGEDRDKPHHREVGERKETGEPLSRHFLPANARDDDARLRRAERAHQQRAQMIPRGFARDDEYPRHGALPARGAQSGLLDGARKNSTISAMSASPSSSLESASTRMASGNGSDNASRANSSR